ncbi:MAG: MBL fold metallo-hydrolase [Gemmataceae bacterium]|jgi:phosphoribosyl 1,2-cyclic phosphate phosphodiesterase|nr:MBL fold metallo-hydrolase [Gemmataceae bacterium]
MSERTFVFLGTGTSVGVPMIGCSCPVCKSDNPKNQRYRSSGLIQTSAGNILIDSGPEMRLQLLRENISIVHSVLYTHYHVDHLFGLDDLRIIATYLNGPVPIYCTHEVEQVIRRVFSYAFPESGAMGPGYVPRLYFNEIDSTPFKVLNETVIPIPLKHSFFHVLGFRIGDLAYCTDVNEIPSGSWTLLDGVKILILDCLRYKPHSAHLNLEQALEIIERINPEQAYLTHMSHEFDYETLKRSLPGGVTPAYDGLRIPF